MRDNVDRYFYPDGINLTLSAKLADLRTEVESYSGSGYKAKKAAITTKFGACAADDKKEISGNRVETVERAAWAADEQHFFAAIACE